jgi:uncharacterized protein YbaA (DUF1428 family)
VLAAAAAQSFKEHGATAVVECWGDDVPDGKLTSFPMTVKLDEGETVVFSWIVCPSKAVRDAGTRKPWPIRACKAPEPVLFSMARMIYGGFQPMVEA